jgi:hypothetical protein
MNPYGGMIHALLWAEILPPFLILALGHIMWQQVRGKRWLEPMSWSIPPLATLNRMHRERFPKSPLRWMRTTCLVLCVTMCAVTAVLIHKNQVANRIYFAQVQKQIQQNAQRVAKTNQEGR